MRHTQTLVRFLCLFSLVFVFTALESQNAVAQKKKADDKSEKEDAEDSGELTLEKIFPEKSMFGPRASSIRISQSGRFGAYLYKPYQERRHGNDLWVYDFDKGESVRLTSVSVMAAFQKQARKVQEDRIEKAAKGKDKKNDDEETKADKKKSAKDKSADKELESKKENGDWVSESDFEDEEAPRYRGIDSFIWHPTEDKMIFTSNGDLFLLNAVDEDPIRLTRTDSWERQVQFLADGSGYTFMDSDVVYRIRFDSHLIEQINPDLDGNLSISSYKISPDGKHMVITASSGSVYSTSERKVNIIKYRKRFAEVDQVTRAVSDDQLKPQDQHVYFYNIENRFEEKAELVEIFHQKVDEPRDTISEPQWSPDSSKVTFAIFDNKTAQFHIMMARVPEPKEDDSAEDDGAGESKEKSKENKKGEKDSEKDGDDEASDQSDEDETNEAAKAKIVYRALHFGGPTTPRMIEPEFAWDSRHIVFVSEQSGFRHVHMLDPVYQSVRQLTSGNFEVYPVRISKDHKNLIVSSTKDNAAQTNIFRLNLETGEMERIGSEDGAYTSIDVSSDGKRAMANFVTYGSLSNLVAIDGTKFKTITDSHPDEAKELTSVEPEFFSFENRHGQEIQGMMFKPEGVKKNEKLPLLIYVYGGPLGTRKTVVDGSYNSAAYFFARYMTEVHGYLTVSIDPRGVSGYGGLFEKSNFQQVGKPQVEDLQDGVNFLIENHNVDPELVGMHGWSFGGFQTQMCMFTAPETFKVGIAGAGPTEWENYNQWYTSATIGDSEKGKADLKEFSLRPLAKNLEGKLLLVHGMEDSNVLFQDTVAVYRELLQAGKEAHVDLFLDPTGGHGLGGDVKTINRYRKYEEFLTRTLGTRKKEAQK